MSSPSTLLTSLLTTLHTHLSSQTAHLPTLHNQLGLPPTALEDDLRMLQTKLMESVEVQIDLRRKEVDTWMSRCEQVEVECGRYVKALGGHVKGIAVGGGSLGELRKEVVLPLRYEKVTEFQEKLRQLYHTKLEQINTISTRLSSLSKTLGSSFFPKDILEPAFVEGAQDAQSQRDVTPERFLKLEKELVRGKAEVTKRLAQLSTTFIQIDWLHTELGIPPPTISDLPTLSTSSSISSSSRSSSSSSSTTRSSSIPSTDPESKYRQILATFIARIEEADSESLLPTTQPHHQQTIPIGLSGVEPTQSLLTWASTLHSTLEETKRRRESHIQAMYDQLEALWRRLGVPESDMDGFVEAHRGSTEETVREYEEELERMLELKRERMGVFIGSAREEIRRLWDDLMVGDEERRDFGPFVDDEHTEELLNIHEAEIQRLRSERRDKAPLLASIKKYFEICEEEKELAATASDQSRLLGRGARDPGRLLREEKMRKRVTKEKPRLEQDLLTTIPLWESQTGRPFLVHGERFLEYLHALVGSTDQENKRKPPVQPSGAGGRAGSVPPRSTTPVNPHGYAPVKSGVVTPAVRSGGPGHNGGVKAQSAPNKRVKVDNSVSSGRVPLGSTTSSRVGNGVAVNINGGGRSTSPTKIPMKHAQSYSSSRSTTTTYTNTHSTSNAHISTLAMPIPKPGTQHHALGHGRLPTSGVVYGGQIVASGIRSASASTSTSRSGPVPVPVPVPGMASSGYGERARYVSGGYATSSAAVARKASRAKRESFKPRASVDFDSGYDVGVGGGRYGAFVGDRELEVCVKEEDEDD